MTLNFPSSPVNGRVYQNWVYDSAKGAWEAKPLESAASAVGPTAPLNPTQGDLWFNTNDGTTYVWYYDGDTGQWVESVAPISANGYYSPNYIINGGFDIWQRGTSFDIGSGVYSADRWVTTTTAIGVLATKDTSVPSTQFNASIKLAPKANGTPTPEWALRQFLEQQHIVGLAGKIVTLSFWYKSSKTSHKARIATMNATNGTDVTKLFTVVANTWTKITLSFESFSAVSAWTGAANNSGGFIDIGFADSTPLTTSDNFYITGVQLEEGATATPFRRNANSIQGELAACQRYFISIGEGSTTNPAFSAGGVSYSTTNSIFTIPLPVAMRIAPTVSVTNITHFNVSLVNVASIAATSISYNTDNTSLAIGFNITHASNASFGNHKVSMLGSSNTTARIYASAEL